MTTNHSWEEDLGTAEEVLAALKEMKAAAGWEERYWDGYGGNFMEIARCADKGNDVAYGKLLAKLQIDLASFFRAELSRQKEECDCRAKDMLPEDVPSTQPLCERHKRELAAWERGADGERKYLTEELLSRVKGKHVVANKFYLRDSWDAGYHDALFEVEKMIINSLTPKP